MFQRLPGQALHHDEEMPLVLADLVNGADVGMVQGRCGASLAAKTLESLRILRSILGKKFQSDEPAQQRVLGFVDHAHAAAAEEFNDPVVGDGLAYHV